MSVSPGCQGGSRNPVALLFHVLKVKHTIIEPRQSLTVCRTDDNNELTMLWRITFISLLLIQPVLLLGNSLCAMNTVGSVGAQTCDCCCGAAHAPVGCSCIESDDSPVNSAPATTATVTTRTQLTFLSLPALDPVLVSDALERRGLTHSGSLHFLTTHAVRTLICVWQT